MTFHSLGKRKEILLNISKGLSMNPSGCTRLTHLDVSCNEFDSNELFRQFCKAIEENRSLLQINLSANRFGDKGTEYLAEALKKNRTLRLCDVRACLIGDRGANALAKMFEKNETLIGFNISANYVTERGARVLAESLRHSNRTLRAINLRSNEFDERAESSGFPETFRVNHQIRSAPVCFRPGDVDASMLGCSIS